MGAKGFGQQGQTTTFGDRNASALVLPFDYAVYALPHNSELQLLTMDPGDIGSLMGQVAGARGGAHGGAEVAMPDK